MIQHMNDLVSLSRTLRQRRVYVSEGNNVCVCAWQAHRECLVFSPNILAACFCSGSVGTPTHIWATHKHTRTYFLLYLQEPRWHNTVCTPPTLKALHLSSSSKYSHPQYCHTCELKVYFHQTRAADCWNSDGFGEFYFVCEVWMNCVLQ